MTSISIIYPRWMSLSTGFTSLLVFQQPRSLVVGCFSRCWSCFHSGSFSTFSVINTSWLQLSLYTPESLPPSSFMLPCLVASLCLDLDVHLPNFHDIKIVSTRLLCMWHKCMPNQYYLGCLCNCDQGKEKTHRTVDLLQFLLIWS